MKLLTPLLAVGLILIAGCYEQSPFQANLSDPALEPISSTSNPVMVPFRGAYDETIVLVSLPPPILELELSGEGVATHLGNSTFFGLLQGLGEGVTRIQLTFTGASGDELELSLEGFTSPPDENGDITFFGDWEVTGGSGRFKNGTGCGTYDGFGNLGTAVVFFDGEISKPTGKKPQLNL